MFARLVTGRYGQASEDRVHAATSPARPGWLRRLFGALFGRKR